MRIYLSPEEGSSEMLGKDSGISLAHASSIDAQTRSHLPEFIFNNY